MGYKGIIKVSGEEQAVNKFIEDIKTVLESGKEYDKETLDFFDCKQSRIFLVTEKKYDPFNMRIPSVSNPSVSIEYAYITEEGPITKELWESGRVEVKMFSDGSEESLLRMLIFGYDHLAD